MNSTRNRIMQTLMRHPSTSINELAQTVGINPISVRHHLSNLMAEGLVGSEEERHGVGRPRLVYYLTENGTERFPTRYLRLTSRLLDQLKSTMPEPMVTNLFSQIASEMAEEYTEQMKGLSLEERLKLTKSILAQEGFDVEWEKTGDQYHIHEITCPYLRIGKIHPEVCSVDQTLISKMLAVPAEKIQCILSGDAHCTFVIEAEMQSK
jgi:DeoR family suf operon transcriptional repressor